MSIVIIRKIIRGLGQSQSLLNMPICLCRGLMMLKVVNIGQVRFCLVNGEKYIQQNIVQLSLVLSEVRFYICKHMMGIKVITRILLLQDMSVGTEQRERESYRERERVTERERATQWFGALMLRWIPQAAMSWQL